MSITALRRILCRRSRGGKPGDFARDNTGSTAMEFALAAPLFFAAFLSIFEISMMFGVNVIMEAATGRVARAVRTGQIYTATLPTLNVATQETKFVDEYLCNGLLFIDCNEVFYNVETFTNFTAANATVSCDAAGKIVDPDFDIGTPSAVVVVTLVHRYDPIIPNPLYLSANDFTSGVAGNCNLSSIVSVLVFRNEPFPIALPGGGGGGA